MITKGDIKRLKGLVSEYTLQDFLRANPDGLENKKKFYNPYRLSARTNEARRMLVLARQKNLTKEGEEAIRDYLHIQGLSGD